MSQTQPQWSCALTCIGNETRVSDAQRQKHDYVPLRSLNRLPAQAIAFISLLIIFDNLD